MNSVSARDASSALAEMYSPCALAYSIDSTSFSRTHSRVFMSLCSMWMSEEDIEIATESTSQSML